MVNLKVEFERPLTRRKLTADDVYEMRCRACDGERHDDLAGEYGVSQSTATRAITGRTFRWVCPAAPWEWWRHDDPPSLRWMPYATAQRLWMTTREVEVGVVPRQPRMTAKRIFKLLDEEEQRIGRERIEQAQRAIADKRIEAMMQRMVAGTWKAD